MHVTEFRAAWAIADHVPGWLTLDEALLLVDAASRTAGPMVEVGSYYGRSAALLGRMRDDLPKHLVPRRLTCVDPWADCGDFVYGPDVTGDEVFEDFKKHVDGLGVVIARCRVEDWTSTPADFWYLDGNHTYNGTRAQVEIALANGAKVVAAHDVNDAGGGVAVKAACLELLGPWQERVGRLAVWELKR